MVINIDVNNIDEFLSDMQKDVFQFIQTKFEEKWYKVCCELAGIEQAEKIRGIDFLVYKNELSKTFISVFNHEYFPEAKAILFSYNLDNDWHSSFFICNEYDPAIVKDEDWACDWAGESIEGPDFPLLSSIYSEKRFETFNATPRSRGITLYLIARTVSSFIEVLNNLPNIDKTVCIGFHEQDPIMRVRLSKYDA